MAGETGTTGAEIWSSSGDNSATANYQLTVSSEWATPHLEGSVGVTSDKNGIHPRLYFKYLKSKLNLIETRFLKERLKKLEKLADEYANLGQEALSEECIKEFLVISRESAIMACGFKVFLTQENVDKYRYKLKGVSLKITGLKNFTRPLPKKVVQIVKKCIDKKLFDGYEIFHLDDRAVGETEKAKEEREKDPIIFGKIQYSDKFYFIADWVDELDDLKLSDIIKKLSLSRKDMTLKKKIQMDSIKTKKKDC